MEDNIKVFQTVIEAANNNHSSFSAAMEAVNVPKTSGFRAIDRLIPNKELANALLNAGISLEEVTKALGQLIFSAETTKIDKHGKIVKAPNLNVKLRAIELFFKITGLNEILNKKEPKYLSDEELNSLFEESQPLA